VVPFSSNMCHKHQPPHLTPPDLATQIIFTHYAIFSTLLLLHSCQAQVRTSAPLSLNHGKMKIRQVSGTGGPSSSVGIVTGYGLEGPGIEYWWGRDFPHLSRLAPGPTQPPVQ
jgi:hypothetical protein